MKNTLMLIAVVIVLILALTACGKIEPTKTDYADSIKEKALAQLGESDGDLFHYKNQWIIVIGEIGYILDIDGDNVGIGEQIEIRIGTSKDLWGTDK